MKPALYAFAALLLFSTAAQASGLDAAKKGYALGLQNQHLAAIEQFQKALKLGDLNQQDKAKTYYNLGTSELRSGNPHGALKAFEQAERLTPDHVALFLNKSEALRSLGQFQKAREAAQKANALRPSPQADYLEGLALLALLQSKEAVKHLEKAFKSDTKNKAYHLAYGKALATNGAYKKAHDVLTDLLKKDGTIAQAYLYRAMAFRGLKDEAKARKDLTTALKIAPDNAAIRAIYKRSRWSDEERNVKVLIKDTEGFTEPDPKSVSMARLKKGQDVDVLKCKNGWCRVEAGGSYVGFVPEKNLR